MKPHMEKDIKRRKRYFTKKRRAAAVARRQLWTLIDALALYETWFVRRIPDGVKQNQAAYRYNIRQFSTDHQRIVRMLVAEKGFLFVRVK